MKRVFALLLALIMMLSLCACGNPNESSNAAEPTSQEADIVQADDSSAQTEDPSSPPDAVWTVEGPEETYEPLVYFPLKPTIEETTLYENDGIRIVAEDIEYYRNGAEINLLIENNTRKELTFTSNTLAYSFNSINGHMFEFGYIYEDVPAGETAKTSVTISGKELSLYGITDIADIELAFRITDDDYNEILTGPCPLKTSLEADYDYSIVSFNGGMADPRIQKEYGITIVSTGNSKVYDLLGLIIQSELIFLNNDGDTIITMEVENTGSEAKNLVLQNINVNGLTVYQGSWTRASINPGKTATLDLSVNDVLDDSIWELAGISGFSTVSFDLVQEDSEYYDLTEPTKISINLPDNGSFFTGTEAYRSDSLAVFELGVLPDESQYSDDYHVVLIYQNLTDTKLRIKYPDDIRINGIEGSSSTFSLTLDANERVLEDITVYSYCFDEVGITDWSEVADLSLRIEITDEKNHSLDETILILNPGSSDLSKSASLSATTTPKPKASPTPKPTPTATPNPTPTVQPKAPAVSEDEIRPEVKEFLDSYEDFMDEYIAFMESYDPTSITMLSNYTSLMERYLEFSDKIDEFDEQELTNAELSYYLEVTNRVDQKLINAAG